MELSDLGLIGNCQFSALVARTGAVVWCCLPRFDAEPMFSTLLDEEGGGRFLIGPAGSHVGRQSYVENTNVLATTFETDTGSFRVLDFAPRFPQVEGIFHPTQLHRIIEPLAGQPRVQMRLDPRLGWSKAAPAQVRGTQHVRFDGFASPVWVATDVPMDVLLGGESFALTERRQGKSAAGS